MDPDSDAYRAARNEDLGRKINERIRRRVVPDHTGLISIICECEDSDCGALIQITMEQYQQVRGGDSCFIVMAGHESPEQEGVIARIDSWVVIEKIGEGKRFTEEMGEA